jgi:hypothetical protein
VYGEVEDMTIHAIETTADTLLIDLSDGRPISIPMAWYPRLWHRSETERANWRLIGRGVGIHWLKLDEDISAEGLILGKPSNESQRSLRLWLKSRQ